MDKKGLVIIYDPHSLQQFLWYYYAYGEKKKWDALCLPIENGHNIMTKPCIDSGIFDEIYEDDTEFISLGTVKKGIIFINMLVHFCIGKRKSFAKKIYNKYVHDIDRYDEIVSISDTGFVSGMSTLLHEGRKISFLDDGMGNYLERKKYSSLIKPTSRHFWESFLFYFQPIVS